MVLAECEQGWRGHDGSGCVNHEYAANVVREVYANGKLSGSVNQRDYSPQQTRNEEVAEKDREPTARDRLGVSEVRQGEDHGWQDRQKDAVSPNNARALHDVSAKEKLFSGGLDRGENQCDRHEAHECREVGVEGEGVRVEEVLSQPTDQGEWHEPRHKPVTDTPPANLFPRRNQRSGVAAVDKGNGDENPREEKRETCHNKQELPKGIKH